MRGLAIILASVMALGTAACGDDSPSGGGGGAPPPPPPPPGPGAGKQLSVMPHIEDLVTPSEKGSIRHQFKERDFAADQNRDPFQSFVLAQQIGPEIKKSEAGPKLCKDDKVIAPGYGVAELRLVGIVVQGISHKALVMGGNVGYILKRSDCVGREKSIVKEISDDYIAFIAQPDPNDPSRPQELHEVKLHPKEIAMGIPELGLGTSDTGPARPVVAPPTQKPPVVAPPPGPQTKIQVVPIQRTTTQSTPPPPRPPTEITP